MQLKKDTPRYAALKKHEDELIEALRKVDMVSLTRSAVKNDLVPMEVVSHIKSLDPSIRWHPVMCRYLFFHVYATIQTLQSTAANPYKWWLTLLSDFKVTDVSDIVVRIEKSTSCMESILASRASPSGEGDMLDISDIPLLAKVLSRRQFSTCWKQLVYSLPLSKGDIPRLPLEDSSEALEQLLMKWAVKFPNASVNILQQTLDTCSVVIEEKGNFSPHINVSKLVSSSSDRLQNSIFKKNGKINKRNYSVLCSILKEYSAELIKYANCLLLYTEEANQLTNAMCTMTPEECLNTVLTMWVKNEFQQARLPTFTNLVEVLSKHEESELVEGLMLEATKCQSIKNSFKIESVWPSPNLEVIEGKSALLEIQASCAADSSVAFDWWLENAGISRSVSQCMITNRFHCLSVAIVHVDVNSLEMEGTYKCKVQYKTNNKEFQAIQLIVKTPLDEYRNKLITFHSEQPEVPKDTWPPVSIDSYINLALIKWARIMAPSYHTIRGDVDDILSDKKEIVYRAVFDNLDSCTRLLVEGRPGSGKTTLVHKASKDLASGHLKFPHNRLLFLVHLRAFSSNPDVGLHDIIRCYPYSDSTVSTISEYAERHDGLGLCFILDGLDEYMPGDNSCFIFRLIRREILPKAVVIIASRPAAAANFRQFASKRIEVIGFRTEQIYEYVEKYPFSETSKCNQLCQYLKQHPRVLHTCYLPIHSVMVCFLFNELEDNLPQTETEIYGEFTKYMILRTLYREGASDVYIESLDDLPPHQKEIFNEICRLAYEMTTLSKQVMKQSDIKSFFNVKESLGLLTVDRTATRLGFQNMYTFLHLTAQEYLAAYYISKLDEEEQLKVIEEYSKRNQMQQVWKFFCGLTRNVEPSKHKFKALLGHSKYFTLYRVQCCFESQLPHLCDAAIENSCLSFSENFLSSSNFEEVAYVLSNTEHETVKKLSFDGCIFGKEEVNMLLEKSDSKKLASVTTLCYLQCSTKQWDVVKYFVHSLATLEVLDVSRSTVQKEVLKDFFEKLNHPNIKRIQIGSVGCVLHSVKDLNLMLVEEDADHPYHLFPYSISVDEVMPVKVLSRELLAQLYKKIECLVVSRNVFTASDVRCIRKLLSRFPSLFSFEFSHNYVGASVLPETCSSLHRLDVSSNCLGNKGAEAIANVLNQCSLLLELNIASNHIGSDGVKSLTEALKTCTKLEKLVLHSNDIRTEGVQALAKSMEHWTNFTSLDVSSNSLTSEAAEALAIGLKECPSRGFQDIHIGNNNIGDSGLKSLVCAVKKCTTLDISSNGISATGLKAIAGNLKRIQELDISGNILDGVNLGNILANCAGLSKLTLECGADPGKKLLQFVNVADVIKKNSSSLLALNISRSIQAVTSNLKHCIRLRELNVSHTHLATSRGSLATFSSCLSCLSQLTTLSLSFTQVEEEGTKVLANGLIKCTSLCKLFIDNNNIGDVGSAAIATVIEKCHQLQVLDVSSNNIGYLGVRSLAQALERSGNLCEFNIFNNDIKSDGERLLCEALEHCVDINTLYFGKLSGFLRSLEYRPHLLKSLRKLHISHNSVDAHHLSKGLKCCKSLQELYISSCQISSSGANKIASSLSKTCHVLDISSNSINSLSDVILYMKDDSSLGDLDFSENFRILMSHDPCFSFSKCTKLSTLNISRTYLRDKDLSIISQGLQHCTILQHLYMAGNKMLSLQGLKALASVLKYFPMLQTLDVSGNNIGDEGAEILADSLQNNPILTTLCIYDCGISQTGVRILDTALNSDTGRIRTRIVHTRTLLTTSPL